LRVDLLPLLLVSGGGGGGGGWKQFRGDKRRGRGRRSARVFILL